jgi:MFS family permease
MENSNHPQTNVFQNAVSFLGRQQRDWKVTVTRTSLERFAYQMVFPYLSIYIIALGATATQLGIINSIGMVIAGLLGPVTGGFVDRNGPKKVYLIGIVFLAISYLTYGLAHSWIVTVIAMIAYWVGFATSIHSCATICGNCLVNRDRATGMMICESVAAGILGMVGPLLATWMVTRSGGINPEGIRPLFIAALIITIGSFIVVLTQLSNQKWTKEYSNKPNFIKDSLQVLRNNSYSKRWLIIAAITFLPTGMVFPFSQVFAHEIKGANEIVLGAMVTGAALASIAFAVPAGRLADRLGRKKVLFVIFPLFWLSNLLLIWSPNQAILLISGIMQGFFYISGPINSAIERELVSADQMGRWIGIIRVFRMTLSALMALLAGIIWDKIGPQYVFLTFIGLDLLIKMPLLISVPETLHSSLTSKTRLTVND